MDARFLFVMLTLLGTLLIAYTQAKTGNQLVLAGLGGFLFTFGLTNAIGTASKR